MIADFQLGDSLGSGNHGQVHKAVPPERLGVDAHWVAVKILDRPATDDEFRRFATELKLFASVDSPHLVPILDAGQQAGTLFYVTEYCESGSLDKPAIELAAHEIIAAVSGAARGAHALHEVGVAHRDIKPTNVLMRDGSGLLADLGLAQVLNPGQTVTGVGPIGSIEYMAPSMVRGDPASRASDIFSLGATLHKALCGRSIFGEIPDDDVLSALRHVLQSVPAVSSDLPEQVGAIVAGCIAAAPEDRPGTALELAEALEGATE